MPNVFAQTSPILQERENATSLKVANGQDCTLTFSSYVSGFIFLGKCSSVHVQVSYLRLTKKQHDEVSRKFPCCGI